MNQKNYRRIETRAARLRGKKGFFQEKKSPTLILLIILLCGIFILGIVGERMAIMELTIQIGEYEKERKVIANQVKRLEFEISHLSSQRRIESLAEEFLNMHYPGINEIVILNVK